MRRAQMEKALYLFSRWVALGGLSILLLLALLIIADILMRWLLGKPYEGVGDLSRVLLPIIVTSCFPIGLLEHRHVTIRFLGKTLGHPWEAYLNLFGGILLLLFFSLVAGQFVLYAMELQSVGEHTWVIQIPMAPWWWITTVVMACCIPLQAVLVFAEFYRDMTGRISARKIEEGIQF